MPDWYNLRTSLKRFPFLPVVLPGDMRQVERYQATVTGGPTSGTTELTLATINIPKRPFAYTVVAGAHWSAFNDTAADAFALRIKVNGTQKAIGEHRHVGGVNMRMIYALPSCTSVSVPANTTATVTVTVQRTIGTGTLTEADAGVVTAVVTPSGVDA